MNAINDNFSIILFDGVCNYCNSSVNRIIKNDSNNKFKFAALQSEKGRELLLLFKIDTKNIDSIILIENKNVFIKSTAILKVFRQLDNLHPLLYSFIIIPAFIRDFIYDFFARNRYKWYGKRETCMIPTDEVKERFIF